MKATTIREAMEMECFPEFLEGLNGHRPAFQDKHVELLLKDDGSRRRVEGLKTNEFANMHLVVLGRTSIS